MSDKVLLVLGLRNTSDPPLIPMGSEFGPDEVAIDGRRGAALVQYAGEWHDLESPQAHRYAYTWLSKAWALRQMRARGRLVPIVAEPVLYVARWCDSVKGWDLETPDGYDSWGTLYAVGPGQWRLPRWSLPAVDIEADTLADAAAIAARWVEPGPKRGILVRPGDRGWRWPGGGA